FAGTTYGNEIRPTKTEEFAVQGSSVTLSCSYSSAQSLFWYRQYPGSAPEFLVTITYRATEAKKSDIDPRFTAKPNKEKQNHVDLEISSAKVTYSALYYCALTPTVTGNTKPLYKNLTHLRRQIFIPLQIIYTGTVSIPDQVLKHLVLIFDGATNTEKSDVDPRLSVILTKREQKHVDLIISSAAVSDSALYYCALQPTVTGNTSVLYKNPLPSESEQEYHTVLN
ncbi:uncharacterized protein LOC122136309, partial [Cyprinus carpio]|uniref:Uncharacterized protein LOC122136309 n=1 Tax=Cyprinus carpio TaxID=7962 RepID=A0A9Q9W1H3_CYPCA